jgi:acetyl esterase/lipase
MPRTGRTGSRPARRTATRLAAAVLALLSAGFGGVVRAAAAPLPIVVSTDVAYGPDPAEILDVCRPAAARTGLSRAVLMIHGGGWAGGDKRSFAGKCRRAASEGLVAFSLGYRLVDGPKGPVWPVPLIDVQLAVRWVRAHAAAFGLDPGQVCAMGDSAGGQLVVMLAALATIAPGDRAAMLPTLSPRVNCGVDNFGPVDFTTWQRPANAEVRVFGALPPAAMAEAEHAASPLFDIDAQTAPLMIVQGSTDVMVPPEQAPRLYRALQSHGVSASLLQLPCGHGLKGLSPEQINAVFQLELAFVQTAPLPPG